MNRNPEFLKETWGYFGTQGIPQKIAKANETNCRSLEKDSSTNLKHEKCFRKFQINPYIDPFITVAHLEICAVAEVCTRARNLFLFSRFTDFLFKAYVTCFMRSAQFYVIPCIPKYLYKFYRILRVLVILTI